MTNDTRRFAAIFRPHMKGLVLGTGLLVLASAIPGAIVFLVQHVLDDVLIRKDDRALTLMPFAVVGLYALSAGINISRGLLTRSIAFKVVERLREDLFHQYLRLGVAYHQQVPTGAQVSRLTNDVNNVQYAVSSFATAVQKPLSLLVLVVSAFVMNPILALVALCILPLVAIPIDRFGRRLRATSRDSLTSLADMAGLAQELLAGIRVVQAFGAESRVQASFEVANNRQYRLQLKAAIAQILPSPITELIAAMGVGAAIFVGGRQVFTGAVAPGELIAFLVALGLMNDPLKGLSMVVSLWQRSVAAADEIFRVLDLEPEVRDLGTLDLGHAPCTIAFERIAFDYGDGPVLEDVSFEARPGQVVALVGSSGSGKTTLSNLVPRFYDPTGGRILVNGHDLRDYSLASLRRAVALVSQETFLFNDTVRANIAFGRPDATDAEILAAARDANAEDFIRDLPLGIDTRIDELGMRLSGGQRQRICIARALLSDAPILVLDEATSALDTESEAAVQEALERLMARRTVLAIAHRLSTIRDAHAILVLEKGRVVERGTHTALLAQGGVYSRLVERQA